MWLGLGTSTAVGTGSTPGQGTKLPQATRRHCPSLPQERVRNLKCNVFKTAELFFFFQENLKWIPSM